MKSLYKMKMNCDIKKKQKVIDFVSENYQDYVEMSDALGDSLEGAEKHRCKWYCCYEALTDLSKEFPKIEFTVFREGEERLDYEVFTANNGIVNSEFKEKEND